MPPKLSDSLFAGAGTALVSLSTSRSPSGGTFLKSFVSGFLSYLSADFLLRRVYASSPNRAPEDEKVLVAGLAGSLLSGIGVPATDVSGSSGGVGMAVSGTTVASGAVVGLFAENRLQQSSSTRDWLLRLNSLFWSDSGKDGGSKSSFGGFGFGEAQQAEGDTPSKVASDLYSYSPLG